MDGYDSFEAAAHYLIHGNAKIQAIKAIRTITNLSLKQAKDVVDSISPTVTTSSLEGEVASLLQEECRHRFPDVTISVPTQRLSKWETVSESLWELYESLVANDDNRAGQIRWFAERFDDIWGVS